MRYRKAAAFFILVSSFAPAMLLARQSILKNGSMEFGPGPVSEDPHNPASWTRFGPTVERSDEANLVPPGAGHALKAFSSDPQVGAYQNVPVQPGEPVAISASLYTRSNDKLAGDATAWIVLEFYKANDQQVQGGSHPLAVLNAGSPADTWIPASLGPFAAPDQTAYARMVCVWTWNGSATGSAYWDDCQLTVNGGLNELVNGDFETAGVGQQSPNGIDAWVGFNDQEKSSAVAKDGSASLKLGISAAYSGLFQNMAVLGDGDHVVLRAYAWNPASDPLSDSSRAGIKLEFDPNGSVPPPQENLAFSANDPQDTWTLVELNTTVPAEANIARIVCIYTGNPETSGSVHFDAAYAERGSAPGQNQLQNESFEQGPGGGNGLLYWTEFNSPGVSQAQKSCFVVPAYEGICTMRATGQAIGGVYQEIGVTPDESLLFHVYLYTSSSDPLTGTGQAGIKVEWAIGGVPADIDIGDPNSSSNTIGPNAPTDTWVPMTIDYTLPPGSNAIARFTNLIEKSSAISGRAYFDACEAVVLNRFDGCDADGDNDEDLRDFAQFQLAFTGPGGPLSWNGIVFDTDDDQDVDMADFNYFAPRMTGPQ
jgi:hypothetical protein